MKTVVLGAGLVGISTAYFLARAGHEVVVVERKPGAGLDTSYANGGQLSAGQSMPWSNPHTPWRMLAWLGRDDAPLVFHPLRAEPTLWRWGLKFLANCTPSRTRANAEKILRMALYSRDMLAEIVDATGIVFEHNKSGILQVFRNRRDYQRGLRAAEFLDAKGCRIEAKTVEECVALEPALDGDRGRLVGGLYSPDDSSGNARLYTQRLAEVCARMGVRFHYETDILRLSVMADRISGVMTNRGMYTGNAYVVALGSYSVPILAPLGLKPAIYPAKGYSVSVPIGGHNRAPRVSITDEALKLVYSRLGDILRIAGTAEFAGYSTALTERRALAILKAAHEMFPQAGDYAKAEFWTGLRPLTPDGAPIIGRTPFRNLYLNTGHGTLGWTLAAASGRVAADLIGGADPAVDISGFALTRFD